MEKEFASQKLDLTKYENNYSEPKLWDKIKKVAKKAGKEVILKVLILYYVLKEPSTSWECKATIIGALGYFILPLDLMPDIIPIAGFVDDAATLAAAISAIKSSITPEIEQKAADKLREWFDED